MKVRVGTVEGSPDMDFAGEHVYINTVTGERTVVWANESGNVLVTVECLDGLLAAEGFVRV